MKHSPIILTLCLLSLTTAKADEALPKIVLIGDSIRLSYAPTVEKELAGAAVVVSPKPNGQDSANVLKHLDAWVIQEKPQVVHFNCGIHDTKRFKETGKFQVSPQQYEANLREIVKRIREETEAKIVFATTTPILDERAAKVRAGRDYELLNSSIEKYNATAMKLMKELNVPMNDLNALLIKPPAPLTTEQMIQDDGVHLTLTAQEIAGKRVAESVRDLLSR